MKNQLLIKILTSLLSCFTANCLAQNNTLLPPQIPDTNWYKTHLRCGNNIAFNNTNSSNIIGGYSTASIMSCGKFDFYFKDVNFQLNKGFNASTLVVPGLTLGTQRRQTLCAVAQYIDSIIDFSHVPDSQHIRILVDVSLDSAAFIAQAKSNSLLTNPGLNAGYVHDYIVSPTGTDPIPANQFHGYLQMCFDSTISYQNGLAAVNNCQYDLYTILLHEMTHILGFYSLLANANAVPIPSPNNSVFRYTLLDSSFYVGDPAHPSSFTKLIVGGVIDTNTAKRADGRLWLNNSATPNNAPIYNGDLNLNFPIIGSYLSHFDDQPGSFGRRTRISPCNAQDFIMRPFYNQGSMVRRYTKVELKMISSVLHYNYNPLFTSSTNNIITLSNHLPYSRKMVDSFLNPAIGKVYDYGGLGIREGADKLIPDFTLTNKTGVSQLIDIRLDTNITDPDLADLPNLQIAPNSVFNIRGCGNGGNNHAQLQIINNHTLLYTPKANFYGIAQFGLTLNDGKENGGFHVYTIKVLKGNNVNLPTNGNYVLNGDFENGTEVKRLGVDELIPNAAFTKDALQEGRFLGAHFADSHPNDWFTNCNLPGGGGIIIDSSGAFCNTTTQLKEGIGIQLNATSTSFFPNPNLSTACGANSGGRFQKIWGTKGAYYYLADSIRSCSRYLIEMDLRTPNAPFGNQSALDTIGFTTDSLANFPNMNYANHRFPRVTYKTATCWIAPNGTNGWYHIKMSFLYPKGTPAASILFLKKSFSFIDTNVIGGHGSVDNADDQFFLDNISIKVDTTHQTVTVTDTVVNCWQKVTAIPHGFSCNAPLYYYWTVNGNYYGNTPTILLPQNVNWTVSITDSCNTAVKIFTVPPSTLVFSNSTSSAILTAFGNPSNHTISTGNTLTITISDTLTIDSNITFSNCPNTVFYPHAQIRVNNGRTLTILDNTVFRAACDTLWDGIYVDGATASNYGTISITNSFLKDMQNGVNISNYAKLQNCNDNHFINNFQSLVFTNNSTNPANNDIMSDTFTTNSTGLLAPYLGQNGRFGTVLKNCLALNIGNFNKALNGGNYFSKINTGIYIENSTNAPCNINIYNNQFNDISGSLYGGLVIIDKNGNKITNSPALIDDYSGCAIFGKYTGNGLSSGLITVNYNLPTNPNKFERCEKGILLSRLNGKIINTTMKNGFWGIFCGLTDGYNEVISYNTMNNMFFGIILEGNTAKNSEILNNTLNLATYDHFRLNQSFIYSPYAIMIKNINNSLGNSLKIKNNVINTYSYSACGINLQNTGSGVMVNDNTIGLASPVLNMPTGPNTGYLYGIYITNGLGTQIQNNSISGNLNAFASGRINSAGMLLSDSKKLTVSCNRTNRTKYGIIVLGDCSNANFRQNTFYFHVHGLLLRHLGNNPTIGDGNLGDIGTTNFDNENVFSGQQYATNNGNLMKVVRLGSTMNSPQPKIYTNSTINHLTDPESFGMLGGVISNSSADKYYVQTNQFGYQKASSVYGSCSSSYPPPPTGVQTVDNIADVSQAVAIVTNQIDYPEFIDVAQWMQEKRIYQELMIDSLTRVGNAALDSFYQAMQSAPINELTLTEESLQYLIDTTLQYDETHFNQLWQQSNEHNEAIISSNILEQNEQNINALYLRLVRYGLDSLSSTDSANLANLALQCPFKGGTAVYKARSLYDLIVPSPQYDDIVICNNAGVYRSTAGGSHSLFDQENASLSNTTVKWNGMNTIYVSPNPTTGLLRLLYQSSAEAQAAQLIVTDMYGRLILDKPLSLSLSNASIDLSNYSNGVYYYQYVVDGQMYQAGKIVLNK